MKDTKIKGIYKDKNKLFTENFKDSLGKKVYNERLVKFKGKEYRSWNPYRSKFAAAMLNGLILEIKNDLNLLYLGAATGTTVSHFSDILDKGIVYSVENSPVAMKKLLSLSEVRRNIIPIFADAFHSDIYNAIVSDVDMIYQDISQRNQAEIFIENIKRYLKDGGLGIIMVKARSIDVSLKPKEAYDLVSKKLIDSKIKIKKKVMLEPYEKDHCAILVSI